VGHAGAAEQAVELLHAAEVAIVARAAVALRHLPVVVQHPLRHDQLVVHADEGEQLAAAGAEGVQVAEGVGHVGDVARTLLRYVGVGVRRHRGPVERRVVRVPVQLRHAEEERCRAVQSRQVGAAIESEPDALALGIARAVPDAVDGLGLCAGEAVGRGRCRAPQTLAWALKVQARGSSITPSVTPSAASHAATADAVACASLVAAIGPPTRSFIAI
jgi:hypothetical protein